MATAVGDKDQADGASSVSDKLTGYVIPTGLTAMSATGVTVQATVVFTPVPGGALPNMKAKGPLDDWPKWIAGLIARGELYIAGRYAGTSVSLPCPARSRHGPEANASKAGRHAAAPTSRSKLLGESTALWKEWLSDDGKSTEFTKLRSLLSASLTCRPDETYQQVLQGGRGTVPDVIGVPRAELARRISLAHARNLMESTVAVLLDEDGDRIAKERAARRAMECCDAAISRRPWSSTPPPLADADKGLAAKYSPYRYGPPPPGQSAETAKTQNEVVASLQNERLWLERQLRIRLQSQRVAAGRVADRLEKLKKARGAPPADRLECLCAIAELDSCTPIVKDAGDVLRNENEFRRETDARLAVHVASGLSDHTSPDYLKADDPIQLRWHMLQSMHAIARALWLIVDIEFDVPLSHLAAATVKVDSSPTTVFAEFSLDGLHVASPRLWTLTKLRLPIRGGRLKKPSDGTCWPATTSEWLIACCNRPIDAYRKKGVVEQIDGVVDMDARISTGLRSDAQRYEVISLDVALAAEAETKRQRAIVALAEIQKEAVRDKAPPIQEVELGVLSEESNFMTAGLQIVDRSRQASVVREFITACSAEADRVVDAVDLSIGYRIDVGCVAGPQSKQRDWRSLVERRIDYSKYSIGSRRTESINHLVDAFAPRSSRRGGARAIDAAILAPGTRLLQNAEPSNQGGRQTAFSEEILTTWAGDPIGQSCGAPPSYADNRALPVSQTISLPRRSQGSRAPHRLRFGRAYAFGMRTVLLGGISRSLTRASKLYDGEAGETGMAYPSSRSEHQRFLRHERIGPPIVATDARMLVDEFAGPRGGIDGKDMVVRSAPGEMSTDERWRFSPSETSRVLFAPTVSLDFATLHGVFDRNASKFRGKAPVGGLGDLDYDADWGGFPVFDPNGPAVEQAVRGLWREKERPSRTKDGIFIPGQMPSGIAAVRSRNSKRAIEKRALQYFPDPAARYLMIALHRPGGSGKYLKGDVIRVSVYPGSPAENTRAETFGYPDARPVILKVKTIGTATKPLKSYDDVRERARIKSDSEWPTQPVVEGSGLAVVVTIFLAPGEDFEIDTWMAPDETHLRAWFDPVEALALLFSAEVENETRAKCRALAKLAVSDGAAGNWQARRGEVSISSSYIRQASSLVHQALMKRPVPEIASVRRLRALHASGQPSRRPTFPERPVCSKGDYSPPSARVFRLPQANLRQMLESSDAIAGPVEAEAVEGALDLLITGKATVDPETTETVELRVEAPALHGAPFDDAARGRSNRRRARGIWDRTVLSTNGSTLMPVKMGACSGADDSSVSYMEELFGFDVKHDGSVVLPKRSSVLAAWPIKRESGDEIDFLELTRQFVADRKGDPKLADRVQSPIEALFPDTRARRLKLSLAATSRTARHIPDRHTYPTDEEAQVDQTRLFLESECSETVILKSTARPDAPLTKSLLPAFSWTSEDSSKSRPSEPNQKRRRTKIRIRLRRPWWSSGEDERLGIVVWPPNLLGAYSGQSPSKLNSGIVHRSAPHISGDGIAEIDLHELADIEGAEWREGFFTDADLGRGGAYVTRWGSDPALSSGDVSWLIPYDAFLDLPKRNSQAKDKSVDTIDPRDRDTGRLWPNDQSYQPRFVENVLMPIPAEKTGAKPRPKDDKKKEKAGEEKKPEEGKDKAAQGTEDADNIPEFMMVSLVTYMPRFDPDFEHWYVDLNLDVGIARDPFVRLGLVRFQPHADRHLQVSHPVCEWVQVVSYARDVTVEREPKKKGAAKTFDRNWAVVSINNPSAHGLRGGRGGDCSAIADSSPPKFRATLIERLQLPTGQITERVALSDFSEEEHAAAGLLAPKDRSRPREIILTGEALFGGSSLWNCRLPLPLAGQGDQRISYAVLVEEFLEAMPASFTNEPVLTDEDIKEDERVTASGPRFAVRIEVPPPSSK